MRSPGAADQIRVSVVAEWETALSAESSRGGASLAALRQQVAEQPGCETVICYDPGEAAEADIRSALGGGWPGPLTVVGVPGLDYYAKKNHGFTLTRGEIVVFVDSDLIPEPGWLGALVGSFDDWRASCIVGRTHLETSSWYERAVALFWIFEPRDASSELRPTRRLVSNNVAFRRALFAHMPFPERPTFRGQCSELAGLLESRRIPLHEQPAARASHPAPAGARQFLVRALWAGRDHAYYDALAGKAGLSQCLANWRTDLRHVRERIDQRAPVIGAGRLDALRAHVLGTVYYTAKALAYGLSRQASGGRPDPRPGVS
jgi:hypothetical protein